MRATADPGAVATNAVAVVSAVLLTTAAPQSDVVAACAHNPELLPAADPATVAPDAVALISAQPAVTPTLERDVVAASPHNGEPLPTTDPATVADNAVSLISAILAGTATLESDDVAWAKWVEATVTTATAAATGTVDTDGGDLVVPCALLGHLVVHKTAQLFRATDCQATATEVSVLVDGNSPATGDHDGRQVVVLDVVPSHPVSAPGEAPLVATEVAVLVECRATTVVAATALLDAGEPAGLALLVAHAANVTDPAHVAGLAVTVAHATTVAQPASAAVAVLHAAPVAQPAGTAALVLHALAPPEVASLALLVTHALAVLQPAGLALLVTHAMPVLDPAGTALLVAHATAMTEPAGTAVTVAHAPAVAEVAMAATAVLHAATVTPAPALTDCVPPQLGVCLLGPDTMRLCPLEQDFHPPLVSHGCVAVAEPCPCTAPALKSIQRTALHRPFPVVTGGHPDLLAPLKDFPLATTLNLHHGGGIGSEDLGGEFLGGILRLGNGGRKCGNNEKNSNSLHNSLDVLLKMSKQRVMAPC